MIREQVEKVLRQCKENQSELYQGEYFLSKIRTLFTANHIKKFIFNVSRERNLVKSKEYFVVSAEIIFNNDIVCYEWEVNETNE